MEKITDKAYKISGTLYLAYNQNGFKQCIYNHFKSSGYSKSELRNMLQNYIHSYPCSFVIIDQTFECSRIYIDIVPYSKFDQFIDKIKTKLL